MLWIYFLSLSYAFALNATTVPSVPIEAVPDPLEKFSHSRPGLFLTFPRREIFLKKGLSRRLRNLPLIPLPSIESRSTRQSHVASP